MQSKKQSRWTHHWFNQSDNKSPKSISQAHLHGQLRIQRRTQWNASFNRNTIKITYLLGQSTTKISHNFSGTSSVASVTHSVNRWISHALSQLCTSFLTFSLTDSPKKVTHPAISLTRSSAHSFNYWFTDSVIHTFNQSSNWSIDQSVSHSVKWSAIPPTRKSINRSAS